MIYPLNNNRSELITNINGLRTGGYTAGQTGIAWGWYTISPFWKNLWPSSSEPGPYNDYDVKKFAIIMTDGDFNTHYDLENWSKKECEKEKKKKDYYGDSLYRGKCKKGKNDYWVERASGGYWGESSKRARKICDNMKKDDIQIYTIYFGSNNSSGGAKVMQYCASEGAYYQATSTEKLIKAFGNIAKKIQAIYLAK